MYSKNKTWIELQKYLPLENQIDDTFSPEEKFVPICPDMVIRNALKRLIIKNGVTWVRFLFKEN